MVTSLRLQRSAILVWGILVVALISVGPQPVRGSPFYYYFQEAAPQTPPEAGAAELTNQEGLGDAANKIQEHVQQATSGLPKPNGELPSRIQGHLSDLYSHGSSAVRGVVETVQPDFKNIGKDLTDVYQATRSQMNKKIEPLASKLEQTVRPYIEHASKAVAPYVNQAKEKVPEFLHSTKERLSGVFDKIKSTASGSQAPANQQEPSGLVSNIQQNIQQHMPSSQGVQQQMESLQNGAKSAADSLGNTAENAAQQVNGA